MQNFLLIPGREPNNHFSLSFGTVGELCYERRDEPESSKTVIWSWEQSVPNDIKVIA